MLSQSSNAKPRLLVVDDEPLNRELLRRVLHSEYQVEEAEDAAQALERMRGATNEMFTVVLCDQLMPGKCGTELAHEVRGAWPDVGFLLITGYDDDPQVTDALQRGVIDQVVSKPWTTRNLKELLRSMVEQIQQGHGPAPEPV